MCFELNGAILDTVEFPIEYFVVDLFERRARESIADFDCVVWVKFFGELTGLLNVANFARLSLSIVWELVRFPDSDLLERAASSIIGRSFI